MSATVEAPVEFRCNGCGRTFTFGARHARRLRQQPGGLRCAACRQPRQAASVEPGRELTAAERERYRRWWLDRFTLGELQELARTLWPEDVRGRT